MTEPSRHAIAHRQMRSHLATKPTDRTRRWVLPSVLGDPSLEISVIASHATGADASCWLGGTSRVSCWHLSLVQLELGRYVALTRADLDAFVRGVFGANTEKTWFLPPARHGDTQRDAPASPYTTHARVFLNSRGIPFQPPADLVDRALIPWAFVEHEVHRT